ncbi:MAG: hypothetical protein CMJ54_01070, partial [Planctomycetaceae bacterium]|nr:hypothetical protein [Planctomycetaceae bacterium]
MPAKPPALKTPEIPVAEYARRRSQVLKGLKNRIGLVHAGSSDAALHGAFRPHPHFEYLTGITDEPG